MEITTGLASDGLLIVPADEPLLEERISSLSQTVETVGIQKGDLSATILNENKGATVFQLMIMGTKFLCQEAIMCRMR